MKVVFDFILLMKRLLVLHTQRHCTEIAQLTGLTPYTPRKKDHLVGESCGWNGF